MGNVLAGGQQVPLEVRVLEHGRPAPWEEGGASVLPSARCDRAKQNPRPHLSLGQKPCSAVMGVYSIQHCRMDDGRGWLP